jgi:FkbM family methyltransferase
MVVNTRRLFVQLLRPLCISDVCDVGSMDGEDAVTFRRAVPHARVYAFEPNPVNYRLMAADRALERCNIRLVPLAISNLDGEADFFLPEAQYSQRDPRRGMGSLHSRAGEWAPCAAARVSTMRLDTFLAHNRRPNMRLALWIDTEGSAYEVVEGLGGWAGQVQLLHIEVETAPCIGSRQRLYPQVKSLLWRLGFAELATDQRKSHVQFNALFVRRQMPLGLSLAVRASLLSASLRRLAGSLLGACCPACLRRYQAYIAGVAREADAHNRAAR